MIHFLGFLSLIHPRHRFPIPHKFPTRRTRRTFALRIFATFKAYFQGKMNSISGENSTAESLNSGKVIAVAVICTWQMTQWGFEGSRC